MKISIPILKGLLVVERESFRAKKSAFHLNPSRLNRQTKHQNLF